MLQSLRDKDLTLSDMDFDTGKRTKEGEYVLADETYEQLLMKLKESNFKTLTPTLKRSILSFYNNKNTLAVNKYQVLRKKTEDALTELRSVKL
jgi:hypothetical protein